MAMNKSIALPSGVTITYHRIERIEARFTAEPGDAPSGPIGTVIVTVGGYLDAAARTAGKEPVRLTSHAMQVTAEPTRAALYAGLSEPFRTETKQVPSGTNGGATPGWATVDVQVVADTGYNGAAAV